MAEDWRVETLGKIRELIGQADPDATETVKWRKPSNPDGVPVWEHDVRAYAFRQGLEDRELDLFGSDPDG